jgi:hypothetical protein
MAPSKKKKARKIKEWKPKPKKCFTCGKELYWTGHPFLKFYKCPKGCKKIFPDILRLSERVNTVKDAQEFIKLNKIGDYEIVVLWSEKEDGKRK